MQPKNLIWFLPSLGFALLWLHVVIGGLAIEEAIQHNIRSPRFISVMDRAIHDPWLHHTALRRYFQKLARTPVPPLVWRRSEWLAYALWNQLQFAGGIEIMMVIAHNQDMPPKERFWTRRFLAVFPDSPLGTEWLVHTASKHDQNIPLRITGAW